MNEEELLQELGKYLEKKGWKVVMIGFKGVIQGNLKNNFSLIIDFVGKKKEVEK